MKKVTTHNDDIYYSILYNIYFYIVVTYIHTYSENNTTREKSRDNMMYYKLSIISIYLNTTLFVKLGC